MNTILEIYFRKFSFLIYIYIYKIKVSKICLEIKDGRIVVACIKWPRVSHREY